MFQSLGLIAQRMRHMPLALILVALAAALPHSAFAAMSAEDEEDNRPPVRLIIGLDLSRSNPLVDSDAYAAKAADLIANEIKDLPLASKVMIRTFGSYKGSVNNLRIDRDISSAGDEKPAAVADLVRQIVANVPKLVRDGTLEAQNQTNIVPFLENMSEFVDCGEMDATVILISDGIEDSEYARLVNRDESLPTPDSGLYGGCSQLEIVGLGQGTNSPSLTEHLRAEWEDWAKAAGFKNFDGFNEW